ncbi:hypothetical protein ACHAXN_003795, partial [Cyclotella atomus]
GVHQRALAINNTLLNCKVLHKHPTAKGRPSTMSYGLATKIASAQESTTYDFSHVSAAAILTIMSSVFSKPFQLNEMIRLTFIVGGGKATRAKYDEGALAACVNGLKGCGYTEDKGAGCVIESAGTYKVQHDTGKNVKTVVVFPLITGGDDEAEEQDDSAEENELIPKGSIGYKIAISPMSTFTNLLSQHCPTYLQKKRCLRTLSGLLTIQASIENKLMIGQQLDPSEQVFYDCATDLKEKMDHVQNEASKHIDEGNVTAEVKKILVDMNEKKINKLLKEDNSAKVADQLKKALARKDSLSRIEINSESALPPLRLESHINTLRKKLLPLKALEEASHQRYLSIAETTALSEMDDIESEIERLETACCGWFEDEEVFAMRVQASRDRFDNMIAARAARKSGATKPAARSIGGSSGGGSTKWILPGEKSKAKNNAWGVGSTKTKSTKGGAVFSAMIMDSSSEEEGSDDENEPVIGVRRPSVPRFVPSQRDNFLSSPVPNNKSVGSASRSVADSTIASATSKIGPPPGYEEQDQADRQKSKKKKKKSKSKKSSGTEDDVDTSAAVKSTATEPNANSAVARADEMSVLHSLGVFASALFNLLYAIVLALLTMLTGLFTGDENSRKKGKRKAA